MAIMDELKVSPRLANLAAARVIKATLDVDIKQHPNWEEFEQVWKHRGRRADEPWSRHDETTRDILSLTGEGACVPLEAINQWTDDQCKRAEEWAGAAHLNASDNDDIVVPKIPDHVAVHYTEENRARVQQEMDDFLKSGRGGGVADTRTDAQQSGSPAGDHAGFESQPPLPRLTDSALRALEYVRNTGQTATIAQFDDDHDPIGPALRRELFPSFVCLEDERIKLTVAGRKLLEVGQ